MMHLLELMRKNQFDEFDHQTPYLALRVTSMYSNNMCGLAVWFQHWTINLRVAVQRGFKSSQRITLLPGG